MTIVKANKGFVGNKNDDIQTPSDIAQKLISLLPIKQNESLLDSSKGKGAFYNNFPLKNKKSYCEIKEGKDFFNERNHFDWIITNPPYSIFDRYIEHCFEISDNVALLCPLSKFVSSMGRVRSYKKYGGIKQIYILSSSKCGFPFGFPSAFVWFKKRYIGKTKILVD